MSRLSLYVFFLQVCTFFGFVPWINFSENQLVNSRWAIFFSIFSAVIIYSFNVYWILINDEDFFGLVTIILLSCWVCIYIRSTCLKRKGWNDLMQLFQTTDVELKKKYNRSLEVGWISAVAYLPYVALIVCSRIYLHPTDWRIMVFLMDAITLLRFSVLYMTGMALNILSRGLKVVTKLTKNLQRKTEFNIIDSNAVETSMCKDLYKNLYEISSCFNDLFGWLWSCMFLNFVVVTCIAAHIFIETFIIGQLDEIYNMTYYGFIFGFNLVSTTDL